MKRVIKCMGMMALVALAFTSCKKNEEKSVFTAATQQMVIEDEDRAYIDQQLKIHFEEGDVCMLFNLSTTTPTQSHCATYAAVEDGNIVEFQNCGLGTVAEDALDAGYYAYYPGNVGGANHIVTELEFGENKAAFLVSADQEYRTLADGTPVVDLEHMYMAAKEDGSAHLATSHFTFKNVCGILSLRPYESAQRYLEDIEIETYNQNLTGWVELILTELDPVEMVDMFNRWNPNDPTYMAELAVYQSRIGYHVYDQMGTIGGQIGNKVHYHVGGVQLAATKAEAKAKPFNIVLRPLAFAFGGKITFNFTNGDTKEIIINTPEDIQKYIQKPNVVKGINLNFN